MPSEPTSGLCGASTSAPSASSTMKTRMATGTAGKLERRRADGRGTSATTTAVLAFIPDPRVDHAVEHVDQQVDEDDHAAAEEHGGLHDGEVAERDALVEQPPDARP